jgi:predicted nicotinamide N-methyase
VVEVTHDTTTWRIAQQPLDDWKAASTVGTGAIVWEGALTLGRYLLLNRRDELRGATVLELGSGCGALAAMLTAASPRIVYATDRQQVMPLLRQTIALNEAHIRAPISAEALEWSDLVTSSDCKTLSASSAALAEIIRSNAIDVLVCSELLYAFPNRDPFGPLCAALVRLIGPRTTCFFYYDGRGLDCAPFFESVRLGGLVVTPIKIEEDAGTLLQLKRAGALAGEEGRPRRAGCSDDLA